MAELQLRNDASWTWIGQTGRDREGDRFLTSVMVHESGRIMAKIHCPMGDEYQYRLVFMLDSELDKEEYQFIDETAARRFAEGKLANRSHSSISVSVPVPQPETVMI